MKELTIEQKAKAYDELIEKLRDFYRDYDTISHLIDVKEELANLIPELKESEDERIRKVLVELVKCNERCGYFMINNITTSAMLAWLEEQKTSEEALQYLKENHSPSEVSDFQAAMNIAVAKAYDKGIKDGLEKQGEEPIGIRSRHTTGKLAEIIKDIESADKIEALRTEYEKGRADAIAEMQKGLSEDDEEEFQIAIDTLVEAGQRDSAKWLKSLKQRIGK